jgi:hypothetical protein
LRDGYRKSGLRISLLPLRVEVRIAREGRDAVRQQLARDHLVVEVEIVRNLGHEP